MIEFCGPIYPLYTIWHFAVDLPKTSGTKKGSAGAKSVLMRISIVNQESHSNSTLVAFDATYMLGKPSAPYA